MGRKAGKPFRLFDAILAAVCVVMLVEAAVPSAAIGNSKYFWWILSMVAFFLPYGLVTAELGTTYCGGGGLYDWINRGFGPKWGTRAAFYYWLQFALWLAALGVLFTEVLTQAFGFTMGTWTQVIIQLIFIWFVCLLSLLPISESKILINICSVFKVAIMVLLGILGVIFALNHGVANPIESSRELLPNLTGVSFIAVVLFNFMGFEVVTTFADEMKNPKRDIPKALMIAGLLIMCIYLFASFGIAAAIPRDMLCTSGGLLDSFRFFLTYMGLPSIILPIVALMFLYSLVANPVVWALGVNHVAYHAAKNGDLPRVFAKESKKGAPLGAKVISSIVASVLVILAPFIPNPDIFWGFFALQIIMLLLPYIMMFPAFLKLRRTDAGRVRPYRVPGGKLFLRLITWVPVVMLVVAGVLVAVHPKDDGSGLNFEWLMIIGTILALIIGEILVFACRKNR